MSSRVEAMDEARSKYGEKRQHEPDFRGPIKNRGCTDVLCLLLLLAFLGGWGFVGYWAFISGNPEVLIFPSDSRGRICGRGSLEGRPHLLFFDITRCINPNSVTGCATPQVCVSACPNKTMLLTDSSKQQFQPYCTLEFKSDISVDDLIAKQICPRWVLASKELLGRCVPSIKADASLPSGIPEFSKLETAVKKFAEFLDLRGFGERVLQDLGKSWWIILVSLVGASLVAFLWIFLMKFFAGIMVWTSLVLSLALLIVSCVYCTLMYIEISNQTGNSVEDNFNDLIHIGFTTQLSSYLNLAATWMVFLIISGLLLLILLIILIFMRKSIRIAVEMIDLGASAVKSMVSTLFFPVFPFLLQIVVVGWFITVGMFLASAGERQYRLDIDCPDTAATQACRLVGENTNSYNLATKCQPNVTYTCQPSSDGITQCKATCMFYKFGPTEMATGFQVYNLFGVTWMLFLVSALDEMVLAGAFASWYWTMDKSNLPRLPLLSSFGRTMFFHLGTLAFGSLIIAIIRVIRAMIEYVDHKLKQYHQENPFVKCMLCCCRCCFWCLESFMKFINRNAYIMTAVYGKNFCWSAKEAFMLLMRNIATTFVLDKVTDFLLFMGKLVIVGGVAVTSYYIFGGKIDIHADLPELNYYLVPVIIITLSTYFIADVFFDVYAMAVDTLFLCYLEDKERNDGSAEKPYYMSKDLQRILGKRNRSSQPGSPEIPLMEREKN